MAEVAKDWTTAKRCYQLYVDVMKRSLCEPPTEFRCACPWPWEEAAAGIRHATLDDLFNMRLANALTHLGLCIKKEAMDR